MLWCLRLVLVSAQSQVRLSWHTTNRTGHPVLTQQKPCSHYILDSLFTQTKTSVLSIKIIFQFLQHCPVVPMLHLLIITIITFMNSFIFNQSVILCSCGLMKTLWHFILGLLLQQIDNSGRSAGQWLFILIFTLEDILKIQATAAHSEQLCTQRPDQKQFISLMCC